MAHEIEIRDGNACMMYAGETPWHNAPWIGQIDDVRVYNRALSAAEIASLYGTQSAPVITARETVDLDADGFIDAIHVSFDRAILDASVTAGDFDVGGVTGEAFSSTTAGDTADDADICQIDVYDATASEYLAGPYTISRYDFDQASVYQAFELD